MLHWLEVIIFLILLVLTVYGFFQPLYLRYKLIKAAQKVNRFDNPLKRVKDAVFSFFFLLCSVKKERMFTGFVHIFILYGSLTFDTVSINHILEGFNPNWNFYGHGAIRSLHSAIADFLGIMVLLGVLYFSIRRWVVRVKSYTYPSFESVWIYTLLVTVTITFYLYEGAMISHSPAHAYNAFLGKEVAAWMSSGGSLSIGAVKLWWWIHIVNVFIFVVYVPRSKYLHMFVGPINIAYKNYKKTGIIKPLVIDLETSEKFGAVDMKDFTWKDLLDSYACMECGRCDDYCPANQTGKPLSPKNIVLNLKREMLNNKDIMLGKSDQPLAPLMDGTYTGDEIWTCTTCGACMYVCPVKNEHIPKIIGARQSENMMEARFPEELGNFFKNMETNMNPWGFGAHTKGDWANDLEIKFMANDSNVDVLYWVGCAGSLDERSKKVTMSMIKILNQAGVNFGVLGAEENCCGDQARRLGNEYMFQMLAQENIETFYRYNVKKILTTCPHGYNTIKNEYPEYAKQAGLVEWNIEVVHHSEFIAQLIDEGKLNPNQDTAGKITFHDPCYLGRHNEILQAPRDVLSKSGGQLSEMKKNRCHSTCCGAGGGLMWMEEKIGTRVNHMRTHQALETNSDTISTSCPFCMTMMTDGVKDKGKEEEVQVKDIAEILADAI